MIWNWDTFIVVFGIWTFFGTLRVAMGAFHLPKYDSQGYRRLGTTIVGSLLVGFIFAIIATAIIGLLSLIPGFAPK